jgi:hypothetical protein
MGFMELFFLVALAGLAFSVWMLVDCLTHEASVGNDKLVWVLVILFAQPIGGFIYYFVRHCKRFEEA